jgi:hypothetical protein
MPRRSVAWPLMICVAGLSCGCATDTVNNNMRQMIGVLTGQPVDSRNPSKDEEDGWNDVGTEARADQAPIQDNDPLRNIFVSPRGQEIERSLGVN